MGGFLTDVLMPVALGVIMLGLGLSLTLEDFRRVVSYPRAAFIGLFSQIVLLPAVAFGLASAFGLPPELAVGLVLLAASPGGATANLFSHLAKGDVALNITLTAINSLLAVVTMPLFVELALRTFMEQDQRLPLQTDKAIQVLVIILVPVAIGMAVRSKNEGFAQRLERPVKGLSAGFLALVILAAVLKERANLVEYFQQVGLAALSFNLISLAVGYLLPQLLAVPRRQAIAVGMEIGVHNGTLAIAVATTVLGSTAIAIPAAIYSLIMFFTAAAFGWFLARSEPDADAPAPV
ncbi:bile acid:sodium symporter family protein [Myxococcota bacterium]|jgi:BASS family bile acid:Na+ symporter|nr:bile acid:sodium symporter family protein [Myxococcota bacterium]